MKVRSHFIASVKRCTRDNSIQRQEHIVTNPTPLPSPSKPKRIYTYVDETAHRNLKVFAAQSETTIDAIIKTAVNLYLLDQGADFQISDEGG